MAHVMVYIPERLKAKWGSIVNKSKWVQQHLDAEEKKSIKKEKKTNKAVTND